MHFTINTEPTKIAARRQDEGNRLTVTNAIITSRERTMAVVSMLLTTPMRPFHVDNDSERMFRLTVLVDLLRSSLILGTCSATYVYTFASYKGAVGTERQLHVQE